MEAAWCKVGGDAPIVVQSMTNTDTADAIGTAIQVKELALAGSELVRITVNSPEAAREVAAIRDQLDRHGHRRAAGRRLPLQRTQAADAVPRLRCGAVEVPHQSGQRRLRREAPAASTTTTSRG